MASYAANAAGTRSVIPERRSGMRYGGVPFVVHWTDSEASVESAQGVRASAIAEWHRGNYAGAMIGGLFSAVSRSNGEGGGDVSGVRVGGVVSGNSACARARTPQAASGGCG